MGPRLLLRLALLTLCACGETPLLGADASSVDATIDGLADGTRVADTVVDAPGSVPGTSFLDPMRAVNGVRGGGPENGSLDVYSLELPPGPRTHITLGWANARLDNGPGNDLVIFENPFDTDQGPFMDLIVVEVSRDGVNWRAIEHDYVTADETIYVRDRTAWRGFAGKTPVSFHEVANLVDPFEAQAAGGDAFDLEDVAGDDAESAAIRAEGITHVRLVTAAARMNPDTGAPFVVDDYSNGPDIDGVYGRYLRDN